MIAFAEYLRMIRKEHSVGDATEHTHRTALKMLLESAGKGITATNEPKRILCGSPDFQIVRKRCPDGSKDENMFDIMQGVAICIMVKHPPTAGASHHSV